MSSSATLHFARTPERRRRAAFAAMGLSAAGIAVFAVTPYLSFDPGDSRVPINPRYLWHMAVVALHGITGGLALLIGPLQFVTAIRRRSPALHRVLGRVYLACVFLGSALAAGASVASTSGLAAQVGFFLLALAWSYSAVRALTAIRRGHVTLHRVWMVRNYALTFTAVLLRVFLAVGVGYMRSSPETSFEDVYTASVWASILVALLFAEWFVVQRTLTPSARSGPAGASVV